VPDEPDPPRKHYGFKEREFARDNAPGGPPAPTVKDLAKLAGVHHDPRPRSGAPKAGDPNDVYRVLAQNRRAEQQHDLDAIKIRKRARSRRLRDFWVVLVGGNLAILGGVVVMGPNVVSVMFGFGGVIIFSIGLAWIMWQVMDRY
jgi:hypothetical protein